MPASLDRFEEGDERSRDMSMRPVNRKTKAAILVEQNAPLAVAEIEIPSLAVGQVLVQVHHTGLCGKQLDEVTGKRGADPFLPHLLGHEGAGIVVEIGPGVWKVKPDDHVVLHWMKGTGIDSTPPTFRRNGTIVNAGWVTTFSEYTVVSENRLTPIPKDIPFDVACLLGCAATTGLGIVFNDASLKPGQSIAVFGVGGVGLNVVQAAALVNAYPIVAIDLHDRKLEQSLLFGATHTVQARRDDLEPCLRQLSGTSGFDVTVDTTGNNQAFQAAYHLTSRTGKTILAGVLHHQLPITIDAYPLHFGRQIIGSHGGATRPDIDIPRYLELYRRGKLQLKEQITHRFRLDGINEALETMRRGEAIRCVIAMS